MKQPLRANSQPRDALMTALVLGPFLLTPSLGLFQKVDSVWSLVYFLLGEILLAICGWHRRRIVAWFSGLAASTVGVGFIASFLLIVAAFAVLYPIANARNHLGGGSDQDEANNLAAAALLRGDYPYYPLTYLDNPLSSMPGSIVLAVPFYLIGNAAYQNLFWLAALCAVAAWRFANGGLALLQLCCLLGLCPVVWHSLVTGNDLFANTLYVLVALQCFVAAIPDANAGVTPKVLAAVFLGVAMASRTNFLLLLPMTAVFVGVRAGWSRMLVYAVIAALVFFSLNVPFWLYDPEHFGPTAKQNVFQYVEGVVPNVQVVMPGISVAVALAMCVFAWRDAESTFWWKCAIIQAVPVVSITALHMWSVRWPSFLWIIYGQMALMLGSWAYWSAVANQDNVERSNVISATST
nr:hypothetical protein [Rhodopirellula sp. SM50]